MKKLEKVILKNLFQSEQYLRKVLPYLKSEYLQERSERLVHDEIQKYVLQFNQTPTFEAIEVALGSKENLYEEDFQKCSDLIAELRKDTEQTNSEWLVEQTEKFCKDKAIYNAILEAVQIYDGKGKKEKSVGTIPQLMTDALSISFDPHIGHDFIENADDRYEFYHVIEKRIPFDLEFFNKITKGGLKQKTLNVALAGCVHPETRVRIRFRKKQ